MDIPSGSFKGEGKTFQTAQCVVVAALHGTGDLNGGDLSCQRRQHGLTFQASDQLADAHMNARTKTDMTAGLARDVVAIRIGPSSGIAIGRAKEHQDFLALADTVAADIDVLRRRAEEGLHRTFKPNGLLKRIAGEGRIAAQPRPFLRKAGEAIDGGAEAVDGGIDTRRD